MAIGDTARLIASLELQDKFSGTARAATGQLSALERATTGAGTRMTGLSRLSAGAGAAMGTFGGRLKQVGGAVGTLAGVGGLLGLVGGFTKTITASRDFDTAMRRIVGLTDVTSSEIGGIREELLKLGPALGKDPQELADAFYFISSAGFKAKDAMDVLNTAARASASGMGQTQDVAQVLGAAINAYGHENLQAADAGDILTAAIKDGAAEASNFTSALQFVLPTAAAVGVSFNDVTAAIAGMTLGGTDASTATTNLNQVLSQLLKPTAATKDGLKSVHLSLDEVLSTLKDKGLLSTLELLRDHFGDNTAAMAKTFGNVRALRGVLGLLNLDADQLQKVFGDTASATGDLNQAFADTEGPGRKMDRAFASLKTTFINLGDVYLPAVADAFASFGEWLQTHQQDVINFGKGALDAVKTLGSIIGGIVDGLSKAWGAIPDPLKDLLVKGFAADRTIKFLFGFSPAKLVFSGLEAGFAKIVGQFAANKLVPQVVTAAAPIPVFVVNEGFGGLPAALGGGEAAAGGAAFGGLGIAGLAGLVAGIAAPIIAFNLIPNLTQGKPGTAPGVTSAATINGKPVVTLDPQQTQMFTGLIPSFTTRVEESGGKVESAVDRQTAAGLENNRQNIQLLNEAKAGRLAQAHTADTMRTVFHSLEDKLTRDPNFKPKIDTAAEFIKLLKRTSEFGARGVGTDIEFGRKTGRDPVGDAFVALTKRLSEPALKSVQVQGEINRHIQALEQVQGRLLKEGNTAEARHAQRNIDALHALTGTVDKTIPHFKQLEQKQDQAKDQAQRDAATTANHLRLMQSLERRTGDQTAIVAGKDFSPKVAVSVNSNTSVSVNDVVRAVNTYSYAVSTYGAKIGNLPTG